jgi:hypothetical protein
MFDEYIHTSTTLLPMYMGKGDRGMSEVVGTLCLVKQMTPIASTTLTLLPTNESEVSIIIAT